MSAEGDKGARPSSRISGFYRLSPDDRLKKLVELGIISDPSAYTDGLTIEHADAMVENVISTISLPCAVAVNFLIDGVDRLIPMAIEEPSVLAAVSNIAKLVRKAGGFHTQVKSNEMIGQVQVLAVKDPERVIAAIEQHLPSLLSLSQSVHPRLITRGGGVRSMKVRHVVYDEPGYPKEDIVVLHFHIDCVDAMGANMINTIAERLAPEVERITGERVGLRILSNLADRRLARAEVTLPVALLTTDDIDGAEVAERIAAAWRFAWADPYRAATHNKGVMNGVDAVALATGNDWRAIEAGAHAFSCRDGQYRPLTTWRVLDSGALHGVIEIPSQFGMVGGAIRLHPTVRENLAMMDIQNATQLGGIAAAVGLAQNLGALRALTTEGIQAGHMRMHARTVAATVGAEGSEIDTVTSALCTDRIFSTGHARDVLKQLRAKA
jgi:hydroxymethylglutaryl-CoA reductase